MKTFSVLNMDRYRMGEDADGCYRSDCAWEWPMTTVLWGRWRGYDHYRTVLFPPSLALSLSLSSSPPLSIVLGAGPI